MTTPPEDPFTAPPSAPDSAAPAPPAPAAPPQPGVLAPGMLSGAAPAAPPAYGAPAAPGQPAPFTPTPGPVAPAGGFATAAIALTGAYTLISIVAALLSPGSVERSKELLADPDNASATTGLTDTAVTGLSWFVGIASFVFLALWMMRIRTNLTARGAKPGGPPAVEWWGWWVPLANFVLPYLGMRAISRRSVGAGLLLGWWLPFCAVWVLFPVTVSASFRAIDLATGELAHPEALDSLVPLSYATAALLTVSWLFLVLIIRRTTKRHVDVPAL